MSLPYFPYYIDDYEADTVHLTIEQDGAYVRLLRLCWRTPGCSIPIDPIWIRRRLRVSEEEYDRSVKPVIEEYFTDENGRLFQKRLRSEWVKTDEAYRKKVEAGRRGGKAKALKNKETEPSNALATRTRTRTRTRPRPITNGRIEEELGSKGVDEISGPFGDADGGNS